MLYILLFSLTGIIFGGYYYYDKKLLITRKQLMITSNQFTKIRDQYANSLLQAKNVKIEFLTPQNSKALTNSTATIFIAPLPDSPILKRLNVKMEVRLLDHAILNDASWFYVSLPVDTTINCRGWINQNDLSIIYNNSNDLIKSK